VLSEALGGGDNEMTETMLATVGSDDLELADFLEEAGEDGREAPRLEALVYRLNEASDRAIDNLTLLLRLPISISFRANLPASRRAPAAKRRASSPEAGLYDAAATSGLFSDNRRSATALIWLSTSGLARMKRSKSALRNTRSRQ